MSQFLIQAAPYTIYDTTCKPLLLAFLIQVIFLFITNIYVTHKIVGPIYHLKQYLKKN